MKSLTLSIVLLGSAFVLSGLVPQMQEEVHPTHQTSGLEAHEEAAGASLLGQFRTSGASWLYLHADLYLHNGVQMRPLTDSEKKDGREVAKAHESEAEIDHHEELVTAIPDKSRDFRILVGDLERETTTYKSMENHTHNSPVQTLPLYRLMTWSDPQFIEGWVMGATILRWEKTKEGYAKALQFLDEGLAANPGRIELIVEKAVLAITANKDNDTAIALLSETVVNHRERLKELTDSQKEALGQAYRWLALCMKAKNEKGPWKHVAIEGNRLLPDDIGLQHLAKLAQG